MALYSLQPKRSANIADILDVLISTDGSNTHGYLKSPAFTVERHASRNLADAVHYLCIVHGRTTGIIELTARKTQDDSISNWMEHAVECSAQERANLSHIAAAAGPIPGTPGQSECEAVIMAQCHALDMLALSERVGCAVGAAIGLILDWAEIRRILDIAARRFGVTPLPAYLPSVENTYEAAITFAKNTGIERALGFGAQQILYQHRGLWDILESRRAARIALG